MLLRRFPYRALRGDAQSLQVLLGVLRAVKKLTLSLFDSVWDVVPQTTCDHVFKALLTGIEQPRNDSTEAEINALCAAVSNLADHVGVAEWPGLVHTMQRLSRPDASSNGKAIFFKILYEAPVLVADSKPSTVLRIFENGLPVVDNTQTPVLALKAVLAVLQTDDKAEQLQGILPSVLEVGLKLRFIASAEHVAALSRTTFERLPNTPGSRFVSISRDFRLVQRRCASSLPATVSFGVLSFRNQSFRFLLADASPDSSN